MINNPDQVGPSLAETKTIFKKVDAEIRIDSWLREREEDIMTRAEIYGTDKDQAKKTLWSVGRVMKNQLNEYDFLDDETSWFHKKSMIFDMKRWNFLPGTINEEEKKQALSKIEQMEASDIIELIIKSFDGELNKNEQNITIFLRLYAKHDETLGVRSRFSDGCGSIGLNLFTTNSERQKSLDHEMTHYFTGLAGGDKIAAWVMSIDAATEKNSWVDTLKRLTERKEDLGHLASWVGYSLRSIEEASAYIYQGEKMEEIPFERYADKILGETDMRRACQDMWSLRQQLTDNSQFDQVLSYAFRAYSDAVINLHEDGSSIETVEIFWQRAKDEAIRLKEKMID